MTGRLMLWKVSSARTQSGTLDLEQATVGRKADLAQFREILQAFADGKIAGVVDRSLGTQRGIFLAILLDACVFAIDVR